MVHSHTNPLFDTAVFKLCALCGTLGFVLIIFFKALPVLVPCCPALPALFWFGERHYVCDMGGISLKHKIWKKPAVSSTKYNGYVESWSILISPLKPFFSGRKINETDHGCTHLCRDRERERQQHLKLSNLLDSCSLFALFSCLYLVIVCTQLKACSHIQWPASPLTIISGPSESGTSFHSGTPEPFHLKHSWMPVALKPTVTCHLLHSQPTRMCT